MNKDYKTNNSFFVILDKSKLLTIHIIYENDCK